MSASHQNKCHSQILNKYKNTAWKLFLKIKKEIVHLRRCECLIPSQQHSALCTLQLEHLHFPLLNKGPGSTGGWRCQEAVKPWSSVESMTGGSWWGPPCTHTASQIHNDRAQRSSRDYSTNLFKKIHYTDSFLSLVSFSPVTRLLPGLILSVSLPI